jgi:hypothetical protein
MVFPPQKRPPMQYLQAVCEPLENVQALNTLFLGFLQRSLREGQPALDLPRAARAALRRATTCEIEHVARFPRALFRLELGCSEPPLATGALLQSPLEQMRRSLNLTILLTAWHVARASDYRARLFFALDQATTERLRATSLEALLELAAAPALIACAFARTEALWCALFRATEENLPAELVLLALQPDLEAERCTLSPSSQSAAI